MPTVTEKELVREFAEIHGIRADSLEWLESTILNDSLAFDEFVKSKEKQNRCFCPNRQIGLFQNLAT